MSPSEVSMIRTLITPQAIAKNPTPVTQNKRTQQDAPLSPGPVARTRQEN